MARRLNPNAYYIACRWNYHELPRSYLRSVTAVVINPNKLNTSANARCVDYGPAENTGRIADLSPGLARDLGLQTDDEVVIHIPYPEHKKK